MVLDLLKANGDPFHDIKIYDFEFNSETMSGKKITCSFLWKDNTLVSTKKEYVMYNDEKFTMSKAIPLEQKGMLDDNSELKGMVKYTCEFSSEEIILENIYISDLNYDDVVVQTRNGNRNFYFYDNVSKFASFINANLSNTIPTLGWTCVTQTALPYDILSKLPEKPIPFNDNTVAEALKSFYDNYKVPFYIENKTIYLGMPSVFLSKTLKFGQGLGLKNNDRIPKNNKVITRIAGRGSDKNLPFRYPIIKDNEGRVVDHPYYRDHLMPTCYVNAVRSLVVDGIPTKIIDYYDADSAEYPNQIDPDMPLLGIKEFDIFPTASHTLIGMVTLVEDLDDYIDRQSGELRQSTFKVKLPILPFDLYTQANVDGAMTLSMTSGACKGSQFKVAINDEAFQKNFYVEKSETITVDGVEVTNTWIEFDPYNPDRDLVMFPKSNEEQIELELFKDIETWGKNYVQPNKWQYLAADSFNFLNIEPHESMITSAQASLDNAMKAYLLDNNTDKYEYPLVIDEYFLQQNEDLLPEIKNNCLVKFDFKGSVISLAIQTITISYGKSPLPKYDIKLTDEIVVNLNSVGQLHDAVEEITTEINSDKLINSRRATDYYSGLKKVTQGVFDADGNNRINDLYARVLYANAAIFGQESSNFAITGGGVTINNVDDLFTITGGATIQHFWDVITGTRMWYIPLTNTFELPDNSTDIYYLYVKANRADSSAWWIVSKDQKKYDSVEGLYYFIAGTFAPMIDGGYKYYSQNGQTSILGGTVALTNIQSPNYLDLGSGGIYGMCIDFLNGRLMAGNGSGGNFITINKDGDGKVRIRGAIVQDSAGNASPILTDRGNWVNTAMYYVGNYFNYNGSSYQCISDTLIAGTLPTNTTYFKPFALKGDPGVGISSVTEHYLATTLSTGVTTATAGWTTSVQTITATNKYLWNYETITYTDAPTTNSAPAIIGVYGDSGVGISSVTEHYLATTLSTGVTTATAGWTTSVQAITATNKYLWNYETITYTDASTTNSAPAIIGVYGDKGVGISSATEHYLATTLSTGVTTATAGWTTSVQAVTATNKYLWNYETITYTDASTTNSAPAIIGVYGDNGVGISSVTEHYLATTLSTGVTTATAGWTTTIQTVTTTNKYLWNYETVNYTDSTTANTLPVIIGVYGDTGDVGTGISSITEEYYLSTSKTEQLGGSWVTTPPAWATGLYIWTRSKIIYSNPTSTVYTTPIVSSEWEAVNDIQVGGRNLLVGSSNGNGWSYANRNGNEFSIAASSLGESDFIYSGLVTLEAGRTITISFESKQSSNLINNCDFYILGNYSVEGFVINSQNYNKSTEWTKNSYTVTVPSTIISPVRVRWDHNGTSDGSSATIYIRNAKLEYGNKATDWTPAPEDIQSQIDDTITDVDVEYYLSTSNTSLSGGSWVTTAPVWVDGKYMWSRTKNTYSDGTITYSPSENGTCIAGATGANGQDGISIVMQDIVNINCNANGDPRSGTLNQDMFVYAYQGGSLATIDEYGLTLISGTATATIIFVSTGILKINITGITSDTAKFNVYLSIEIGSTGTFIDINRPLYVNKVKDGYGGAAKVSRGEYQNGVEYHGTYLVTDVVSVTVGGTKTWYQALVTAGNITNIKPGVSVGWDSYWKLVTSYDEIATGGLFAENANVAEFIFNGGKMRSQYPLAASMDNKNLILDGVNGRLTALDAVIRGNITAESGSIGNLNISGNTLVNSSIKITTDGVPNMLTLVTPSYLLIVRQSSWSGPYANSGTFNVTSNAVLEFKIKSSGSGKNYGWTWQLRKYYDDSVVASGSSYNSNTKDLQTAVVKQGGLYYIYAAPYVTSPGDPYVYLYGAESDDIMKLKYYEQRTVIADDGFYSFFNGESYVYFKQGEQFHARIAESGIDLSPIGVTISGGTNGEGRVSVLPDGVSFWWNNRVLRISDSGFQKSTNGGDTWTSF